MEKDIRESIIFLASYEHHRQMNESYQKMGIGSIHGCGVCNGYVAVPPEHPLYGLDYETAYDMLRKAGYEGCHHGFTYSDPKKQKLDSEKILCDNLPDDFDDWWVFGFDTCHCDDNINVWNEGAVISETLDIKEQLDGYRHIKFAKDCKCLECGKPAVAFWPCIDPDIPSHPYCRECLDKAKLEVILGIHKADKKKSKKRKK